MARKTKELSEDDLEVWREVAKRIERRHPLKAGPVAKDMPKKVKLKSSGISLKPFHIGEKLAPKKPNQAPSFEKELRSTSPNMDRKNFQKLLKGKMEIDGTLDLHGLTADQAKARLTAFVIQSHTMGFRLLLVITGKGKHERTDEFNRARGGILRQSLPDWLRSTSLSSKVLQVTPAQPKHGGTGAYYVYLRRTRQ